MPSISAVPTSAIPIDAREYAQPDAKRPSVEREQDLLQLAELLLQGESIQDCARQLSISVRTAQSEYQELKRRWRMKSMHIVSELHAVEMAKLDLLEKRYWEAFQQSQRTVIAYKEADANGVRTDYEVVPVPGDAKYLDGVLKVMADRARRVGLYPDMNIRNYQRDREREQGDRPVFAIPEGADYLATISAVQDAIRGLRDTETDNEVRSMASGELAYGREDSDDEDMSDT